MKKFEIITLVASIFANLFSIRAIYIANSIEEQKFATSIIDSSIDKIAGGGKQAHLACAFLANHLDNDKIKSFVETNVSVDHFDNKCKFILSEKLDDTKKITNSSNIGAWHAVVVTYPGSDKGLEKSRIDRAIVERDLKELNKWGYLRVIKTKISNNYAVTIDTGDNREKAISVARHIRSIAEKEDWNFGRDAFVQENRGWETVNLK